MFLPILRITGIHKFDINISKNALSIVILASWGNPISGDDRLQEVFFNSDVGDVSQVFEYAGPTLKDFLQKSPEIFRNGELIKVSSDIIRDNVLNLQSLWNTL